MSGLLQRLLGQARATGQGGSKIRSAISVHAQVPLGGAAAEAPGLPSLDPGPQTPGRGPDTIYKSEPGPAAREVPAPRAAPQAPQAAEPVNSPRMAAVRPGANALVRTHSEMRLIEREVPVPQPLLAEAPAPSIVPMIDSPLVNAARGDESLIRSDTHRDTTEVHVHIGRIDVISAPEPAVPKKTQRPAARPTIPLAEYLAKKARP